MFLVIFGLWVGLSLAIPDAWTYYQYAALNGRIIDARWHLSWAGALVRIGAPLGVYIFALNNLYRFCVLVLRDLASIRFYALATWRYVIFFLVWVLALVSVLPFYGMAKHAGLPMFVVWSNAFARFCMNDFAFFFVMSAVFDRYLRAKDPVRQHDYAQRQALYFAVSVQEIPAEVAAKATTRQQVVNCLKRYPRCRKRLRPLKRRVLRWVGVMSFVVGTVTAVYLFPFAHEATRAIFPTWHPMLLAVLGIVPTCLLWGHDAAFSWRAPLRFLLKHGVSWRDISMNMHYATWLKVLFVFCIVVGTLCIAVPATVSETMMAVKYRPHDAWGLVIAWAAGPAFLGIYMTGIIELLSQCFNALQGFFYPRSTVTAQLRVLQSLKTQKILQSRLKQS